MISISAVNGDNVGLNPTPGAMKAFLIYPNCTLSENPENSWREKPVDCFWVEASRQEARKKILPPSRDLFKMDDPEDHPNFYFLIAKDLSRIIQLFWVFPYSAMHGGDNPFKKIDAFEFESLEELKNIGRYPSG